VAFPILHKPELNTYDLPTEEYKQEEQIIHNILENNSFPIRPQKPHRLKLRKPKEPNPIEKKKWATFTYIGRETTFITNIFKQTNIKIAFRTNIIGNELMHKQDNRQIHTLRNIQPTNTHSQEYTNSHALYVTKRMWVKPEAYSQ
jgi:hypothetical protein